MKYVFWIAIAGGVVYGGYYTYENWLNEGASGDVSKQVSALGEKAGEKAGEYAKAIASTTKSAAGSFVKEKIGDWVSVIGEEIVSLGKGLINATSSPSANAPVAISPVPPTGSAPAPTSSVYDVPPPPATIVISAGESLSFSINSGQVYKVDWGDGNKDQGATTAGSVSILRHQWSNPGDYEVSVSVGNSVTSNVYSFPVRVY